MSNLICIYYNIIHKYMLYFIHVNAISSIYELK